MFFFTSQEQVPNSNFFPRFSETIWNTPCESFSPWDLSRAQSIHGFIGFPIKQPGTLPLISMMIPFASIMVPLFKMFSVMHLMNSTLGFILPTVSTAFLIFFFRQNSVTFPLETIQAARVDGLGEFSIYLKIYLPIMAPTFAAAAIVTFMNNWNNYMRPLIVMQSQEMQTLPLLVSGLTAGYTTDYGLLMLSLCIMTIPTVVLFFTQQKRFVSGILGAVK